MGFRILRDPEAFSLSPSKTKRPRKESKDHLAWLRTLPSVVSGKRPTEAAHIRFGSHQHGKPQTPMGRKPDDKWAVPLTAEEHRTAADSQHAGNEQAFWDRHKIDPLAIAALLYAVSGDDEAGEQILQNARRRT